MYPDYVEAGSAYELLADAYEAKGTKPRAMKRAGAILEGRRPQSGRSDETGDAAGRGRQAGRAVETLERLIYIYPMDEELHRRLGDL